MRYVILKGHSSRDLADTVNSYLDQGYELTGGVSFSSTVEEEEGFPPGLDETWVQAMFKR